MLTSEDINRKLKMLDEITVLEILDIHSEELVDRFEDKIEERYDYLLEELEDGTNE